MWKWFYQHCHHPKWTCGCFLPIYRYHSIYSKKYTNFKNKSLFNNGNILDINDFYNRNRGNVSLTYWVVWKINTLSNQDFVGMDKFRLRASLGKVKDMRVKMNKMNKVNRNESNIWWETFLTFSPGMVNLPASSSAGESASLTLDKRESLESKLPRAYSDIWNMFLFAWVD